MRISKQLHFPFLTYLFVLILPWAVLSGCSVNPATGQQSFTAFMSPQEELRVGSEEHPKILKQFGGEYKDSRFTSYVRRIGLKLARVSDMPNLKFTITVLNDSQVNAFALPGGFVYITRGLLALAENEAEMAGVLAHEIGHVTARHTAERYSQAMAANIGLAVLGALTSGSQGGGAINQIAGLGAQLYLQGYSRDQELEADLLAVRYMSRAGYDPNAMTSFFYKMRAHTRLQAMMANRDANEADQFDFFSTHPRTVDRITQAMKLARAQPVRNPKIARLDYLSRINGLTFGDDREQGVRRGRTFSHPGLRFQFEVPPQFTMFNSPEQVLARGPHNALIVFDLAPRRDFRAARSLRDYLTRQWGGNLNLSGVERLSVNGLDAYTGASRVRIQGGTKDVRLVVISGRQTRIYRFVFLAPPNTMSALANELKQTTYSFRHLSAQEASAIRSLRLKLVAVKAGDTVASLAARQPVERFSVEWFELLNSANRRQPLRTGRLVKIITE